MNEAPVLIRAMTLDDVPAVVKIEESAFHARWEKTAYERELQKNQAARYLVAARDDEVVGFAGLWMLLDEAHVVTVGVAPEERRKGYGRLLVSGLIEVAKELGASNATLECRDSNASARALYRSMGFLEVGRRVRYYSDNGEDAIIMTTEELGSPGFQSRVQRAEASRAG